MQKSEKILVGKEEICAFAGFSKNIWPEMMAMGFPAVFFGGKWRAFAENVEKWAQAVSMPRGAQVDQPDKEDES